MQTTAIPKTIRDTFTALQARRVPLAAELDAIDLAETNLRRLYSGREPAPAPTPKRAKKRKPARRQAPAKVEGAAVKVHVHVPADSTDAAARREVLLTLIQKSEVGLTIADLRQHTPKMATKDRQNALSKLKADGYITRRGNSWVAK